MDWFRWWHGTTTDPKFQRVARLAGATVADTIAVWACLLEHASTVTRGDASVTRGDVSRFNCDDHDVALGLSDGKCRAIVSAMCERGVISEGRITRWDERQPPREDSSAARTREYREKRRKNAVTVTHGDASVTQGDVRRLSETKCDALEEKRREEEKEEKKNNTVEPGSTAEVASPTVVELKPKLTGDVQAVFEHWQRVMGHPQAKLGKSDSKRYRAIAGRLRDGYTVETLKQAIDGCKSTPWNMGKNDRSMVYDDIELICRDAAHVDRFAANATSPAGATSGEPSLEEMAAEVERKAQAREAERDRRGAMA